MSAKKHKSTIPKVILLVETSRAFGRDLIRGVARYSRIHGPWAFYRETGGLENRINDLVDWDADGIIMRNPPTSGIIQKLGLPTIYVIHRKEDTYEFPAIDTDGKAIGQLAAEHLLDRGFKQFAYCGFDEMSWSLQRGKYFSRTIEPKGYKTLFYKQPESRVQRLWKREQNKLAKWIQLLPKPIGLLACNDERGQHVLEACKLANVKVPDELAVIGVDNDELVCDLADPPLTSIALNTENAGYQAAEILDNMMKKGKISKRRIYVKPTRVITRQSTDIFAVDDQDVAHALRFIRQHPRQNLCVDDVTAEVALSRRVLEKRFRNILNRSVYQEIRQVRVKHIVTLLAETNLSIAQIAQQMNFTGPEHIARYFRNETQVSLRDYRMQFCRQ